MDKDQNITRKEARKLRFPETAHQEAGLCTQMSDAEKRASLTDQVKKPRRIIAPLTENFQKTAAGLISEKIVEILCYLDMTHETEEELDPSLLSDPQRYADVDATRRAETHLLNAKIALESTSLFPGQFHPIIVKSREKARGRKMVETIFRNDGKTKIAERNTDYLEFLRDLSHIQNILEHMAKQPAAKNKQGEQKGSKSDVEQSPLNAAYVHLELAKIEIMRTESFKEALKGMSVSDLYTADFCYVSGKPQKSVKKIAL